MPQVSSDVVVTEAVEAVLEQRCYRCPKCLHVLPADKFYGHTQTWCVYCMAEAQAAGRDKMLSKKADDLAQRLISDRGLARHAMSTVEEFFGELDVTMGGPRMYAAKMVQIIDGLMDKKAFTAAGMLLLQLQKLRFLVQKQHTDEDFTQLDLEQKKARLQLEILQFVKEQGSDDPARLMVLESLELHGVMGQAAEEFQSTLKV